MSAYEPGTVAVATVRGVPNIRIFRGDGFWRTAVEVGGYVTHYDFSGVAKDVRPLVVLDLDGMELEDLLMFLRSAHHPYRTVKYNGQPDWLQRLADQIEAQTKPPRIPEPTGFAPVVEAGVKQHDERLKWYRNAAGSWTPEDRKEYAREWDDLVDPVLVRDGIEDGVR